MSVRAAHRPSPRDPEPVPDVLVSGDDDGPWRPTPTQVRRASVLLGAALVAGAALLVPPWLAGPVPPDAGARQAPLVLRSGPVVLPRRDAPPSGVQVRGGVHVEVVNEGRRAVHLTSAALVPGRWDVSVVQDVDNSVRPSQPGRLLRPGWSAVLVVHRRIDCSPGADHGPAPVRLVLEADVDGRTATGVIDVGGAQTAYGGRLDDLLGSPGAFCTPGGGPFPSGLNGQPGQVFLQLAPPG